MPGVVENHDLSRSSSAQNRAVINSSVDNHFASNMKGGSRNRYPNGYSSDQLSDVTDDGPRYFLEHLATFSVGSEFGLVSPKDGLRRLLQMEKTSGIWTQKMQMKLDKNWVLILDYDDGDVVEKFPMNLISDPTAYTSDDPRELYNNILIFIVREDPKSKSPSLSEMHIFQCARVYAQDVVDEMKMFMTGKVKAKTSENIRHLPPPPHNPPPDPPINGNNSKVRDHVAMFSASTSSSPMSPPNARGPSILQQRIERAVGYTRESNDETSSTTSDKYEREVTILNHCFDDIERFVVRLQHSAAAFKELERRQKNRKHKKKDMGDGMLSIRAKPPPEREFVDVLQKFKLSFNLLAKLKSHIHDPNAPELVHFLFTPLALIIDAARDSNHNANLAANVVSPLLTRDAIELLVNCCTSKETDLWHSLGDSWIIPRDEWKGYESNYRPVFSNGWAPENPIEDNSSVPHRVQRPEPDLREQDYQRVFGHPERDSRFGSEYFGSERDDHEREESPGVVPNHPHMRPAYERQYEHLPPEARRDYIDRSNVISRESDFHDPRDRDMRSEFSSDSIEHSDLPLSPERQFDRQQMQWLEDLKNRRAKIVQVVYPRTANNEKELTVIRGEILEILDDSRKWWKARNMRGQVAHVPHTIVTPYPSLDEEMFMSRNRENYYSTDGSPVKEQYIDEGSTRSHETSRSPTSGMSHPAPADWIRRERLEKKVFSNIPRASVVRKKENIEMKEQLESPLPSPPPEQTSFPSSPNQDTSPPNWLPPPPDADPTFQEEETSFQKKAEYQLENQRRTDVTPKSIPRSHSVSSTTENKNPSRTSTMESRNHRSISNSDAAAEMFQQELKASIAQKKGQRVWKKIVCPEHNTTDCFYIGMKSSPADVMHWLGLKGFSENSQEILKTMSTEMLFRSKKDQLEKYLGEEGTKLHSQLLIQKNMCGYKTYTSEELKNILDERRQKVEVD